MNTDSHIDNDLYLLAVNLTRRCNLRCAHCYLDAGTLQHGAADELTTREVCHLLDEVASRSTETMVVLTGGEPLVRRDLEALLSRNAVDRKIGDPLDQITPLLEDGYFPDIDDIASLAAASLEEIAISGQVRLSLRTFIGRDGLEN